MIEKRILVPDRVRRPPREGFWWVDRRFLREHAPQLSRDAVRLYFFLAAVSDRDGLSFWQEAGTAAHVRTSAAVVVRAREELVVHDLVAHEPPFTQVLSLPAAGPRSASGDLSMLGEILGRLPGGRR